MKYTSAADEAKIIRDLIKKEFGYTSRQVSVKSRSSTLDITIKDPMIKIKPIEEIAKRFQKIDRCEASGEILSGGNRYVFVDYSDEARAARAQPYLKAVEAALETIADESTLARVDGTTFLVGKPNRGYQSISVWNNGHVGVCFSAQEVAATIGLMQ